VGGSDRQLVQLWAVRSCADLVAGSTAATTMSAVGALGAGPIFGVVTVGVVACATIGVAGMAACLMARSPSEQKGEAAEASEWWSRGKESAKFAFIAFARRNLRGSASTTRGRRASSLTSWAV